MIEEDLRAAFARKEAEVPDAWPLVRRIDAGARQHRRRRVAVQATGAMLAVGLLALGIPGLMRQINPALMPHGSAASEPARPLNIVIAGTDQSDPQGPPGRTDIIILAHVPADRSGVYLLTIPRDLWVDIDAYPPTGFPGRQGKINEAYVDGGAELLRREVAELTGVSIDGTAILNFPGFVNLVDRLGGVHFCLDAPVTIWDPSVPPDRRKVYPAGCATRGSAELLQLLTQRKLQPVGDFSRQQLNAQFLAALARQVTQGSALANLGALRTLYDGAKQDLTLDLGNIDPVALVWELRSALGNVQFALVPAYPKAYDGVSAVALAPEAPLLFDALRSDALGGWIDAHKGQPLSWIPSSMSTPTGGVG
jgi:LCP family protein required for cell wall assembly